MKNKFLYSKVGAYPLSKDIILRITNHYGVKRYFITIDNHIFLGGFYNLDECFEFLISYFGVPKDKLYES